MVHKISQRLVLRLRLEWGLRCSWACVQAGAETDADFKMEGGLGPRLRRRLRWAGIEAGVRAGKGFRLGLKSAPQVGSGTEVGVGVGLASGATG